MAILQALLALITKSAGKILNAIFGWAVPALFGKTTARDQTLLSGLVAPPSLGRCSSPGIEVSFYASGGAVAGKAFDTAPEAHTGSRLLLKRGATLAADLAKLDAEYEDWQVLYRQSQKGTIMNNKENPEQQRTKNPEQQRTITKPLGVVAEAPREAAELSREADRSPGSATPESLSTFELMKAITNDVERLVKTQIALAKAEVRADLSNEGKMVAGLGVAAVAGLLAVNLLLVTLVLALATVLPAWVAGLIVSGAVLLVAAIAGVVGWGKRVRHPLARTRHEIQEDVKWTKERMA